MIVGAVAVAEYPKAIADTKTIGASRASRQPDHMNVEEGRSPRRDLREVEVLFWVCLLTDGR